MMNDQPFIYGEKSSRIYPLEDYLPDYQAGVVSTWLSEKVPQGSWILCPFGSSPQIALESAQAGYKVLLPVHNPIMRFLVENLAAPPSQQELNSALVNLASSYKGSERLKPFILSLYETDCPLCGAVTSAVAFSWSKSSRELISKTCRCSACGEESVVNVTTEDIDKARAFSDRSPIHARALTRVTSPSDPIRIQVENALASYPPRSVYALFTILNKLTGFDLAPDKRAHAEILLLHAFYRCSQELSSASPLSTDHEPESDFYLEENVWLALESALGVWTQKNQTVPITFWPDPLPETGGLCIYPGRIKELIPHLAGNPVKAVAMVFPKPTPTFWGLSALWTGWLWGQDAAAPLRGVLSIRDYDWTWMTRAVEITLSELGDSLAEEIPVLGVIPEACPESLISGTSAALSAGLDLLNLALDPDLCMVQSCWLFQPSTPPPPSPLSSRELIRKAGFDLLQGAGEPKHSLHLYGAGMSSLAAGGYWRGEGKGDAEEYYPQLQIDFEENIAYRQGFLHYPKISKWWHLELTLDPLPQADRVEKSLVNILIKADGPIPEKQVYSEIYQTYPSLKTPPSGFLQACLLSYGERYPENPGSWILKTNDQPGNRIRDIKEMESILNKIGASLGYTTQHAPCPENITHLVWLDGDKPLDSFFISASGLINKILNVQGVGAFRQWIILPGSRAGLIQYKLSQNPPLAEIIEGKWELVKFRHLRRLSEQGDLSPDNYLERFTLDPFTTDSPQLLLI